MSIEAFTLINFSMDAIALAVASRWMSPAGVHMLRIGLASLCGTAYAFFAISFPLPFVLDALLFLAVSYAMASASIPAPSIRLRLCAAVLFLAALTMIGGVCLAISQLLGQVIYAFVPGALAAMLMAKAIKNAQQRNVSAKSVTILCKFGGRQACMRALVDTGNRLVDPVTGLPVIAAPREVLAPVLPSSLDVNDLSTMPMGFRLLRAQTAAGQCMFMCFRPERVMITSGSYSYGVRAVFAITGASEGAMALVPECLLSIQDASMDA